jgi:uncharacterized membrane protein YfcA
MQSNLLVTRMYLARGARLWIGVRLMGSAMMALAGTDPLHPAFAATMLIVGASAVLGVVDMHRRHERALLENLAVSRTSFFGFFVGPALVGELCIALAASIRG